MKKIILGFLAFIALEAKAQTQPDPDTTARHFLIVASIANLQEVNAGKLALQKAKSADVRSFGQMMVNDHSEAEQKLLQLAKAKNINITEAASGGVQPDLKLKNAGDNFDRLFVHAMVTAHRSTVETFETYATTGKDPQVKAFAGQTLPFLKKHLQLITAIASKMKYTSK